MTLCEQKCLSDPFSYVKPPTTLGSDKWVVLQWSLAAASSDDSAQLTPENGKETTGSSRHRVHRRLAAEKLGFTARY